VVVVVVVSWLVRFNVTVVVLVMVVVAVAAAVENFNFNMKTRCYIFFSVMHLAPVVMTLLFLLISWFCVSTAKWCKISCVNSRIWPSVTLNDLELHGDCHVVISPKGVALGANYIR